MIEKCTIESYVHDNKTSHVDPYVLTYVIDMIKGKFGDLTLYIGK